MLYDKRCTMQYILIFAWNKQGYKDEQWELYNLCMISFLPRPTVKKVTVTYHIFIIWLIILKNRNIILALEDGQS